MENLPSDGPTVEHSLLVSDVHNIFEAHTNELGVWQLDDLEQPCSIVIAGTIQSEQSPAYNGAELAIWQTLFPGLGEGHGLQEVVIISVRLVGQTVGSKIRIVAGIPIDKNGNRLGQRETDLLRFFLAKTVWNKELSEQLALPQDPAKANE